MATRLEIQDNSQRGVNAAHVVETEVTHALTESARVDCGGLFGEHPRDAATNAYLGPKACSPR